MVSNNVSDLTIHCFLVDIVDPIISIDFVLILLTGVKDLPELILVIGKVAKLLEIAWERDIWW